METGYREKENKALDGARIEELDQRIAALEAENRYVRQNSVAHGVHAMLMAEKDARIAELEQELKINAVFHEKEYTLVSPDTIELLQKAGELEKWIQRVRWHIAKVNEQDNEIERLERELVAAAKLLAKLVLLCDMGKENADALLRPMRIGAGDYMGTGYAFLDAFNRIWGDFISQSGAEIDAIYQMIREEMRGAREGEGKCHT